MLGSRYAMWMGYGDDLNFFYNDAYAAATLGQKRPWALGRPATEVWAEISDQIGPRVEHVCRTGEATYDEGLLLFLGRTGYPEETYHSFSYSPVPGEKAGEITGLFCVVVEETGRVINERRLALLRDLAARLAEITGPEEVFAALLGCLRSAAKDFPFACLFQLDGDEPRALGSAGFEGDPPDAWPFAQLLARPAPITVELAADRVWPTGPWKRPPTHALVLPIPRQGGGGWSARSSSG